MKDRWVEKMNVCRRPLDERGMLLTLHAWDEPFVAAEEDVREVMGENWRDVSERLVRAGLIRTESERGWVTLEIVYPSRYKRQANRLAQRKYREKKKAKS